MGSAPKPTTAPAEQETPEADAVEEAIRKKLHDALGSYSKRATLYALMGGALKIEMEGTPELMEQSFADWAAAERQDREQSFQGRIEYARQSGENARLTATSVKEYGLQTLKWAFLINAGAVALILGYVATRTGSNAASFAPLVRSLWPFATGVALVVFAGAAGYFNFSYATLLLPSKEAMYNFFNVSAPIAEWPRPVGAFSDEKMLDFYNRIRRKLVWTQRAAIACTVGSVLFFIYGLWRVLRLVS